MGIERTREDENQVEVAMAVAKVDMAEISVLASEEDLVEVRVDMVAIKVDLLEATTIKQA